MRSDAHQKEEILKRFLNAVDRRLDSRDLPGVKILLDKLSADELALPVFKRRAAAYYYYAGSLDKAAIFYQDLMREYPDEKHHYGNSFKTLIKLERFEDGLMIAYAALERFKQDLDFALDLVRFLFVNEDYEWVCRLAVVAEEYFAGNIEILWLRGNAQLLGHLQDNGEIDFERCLHLIQQEKSFSKPDIYIKLVQVYYRNSRDEKLKAILVTAYENRCQKLSHYITLIDYFEKTGDLNKMGALIKEADEKFPSNVEIDLFRLVYLRRIGCTVKQAEIFDRIKINDKSDLKIRIKWHHEKARFFESQKDYKQAFAHYMATNLLVLEKEGGDEANARFCNAKNKQLDEWRSLIPDMAKNYHRRDKAAVNEAPIFFVGFPRSGTTLVDQILSSHPDVEVIEEKPLLRQVITRIEANHGGFPLEKILSMEDFEKFNCREIYKHAVKHFRKTGKAVVVNKLPLNIIQLPLILELFPGAKIIVAIRHPMDSVLSCFFQLFEHNPAMANFLTMEGAIAFYDKVMTNFLLVKELYQHDSLHVFRYEDVVEDIQAEAAKLLSFLGLAWNDAVVKFHETARKRVVINTPSYIQVTQPLYKSSVYKWKNYKTEVQEYLPRLEGFIKAFDYK